DLERDAAEPPPVDDGPPPDPDPRRARTDAALGFVNEAMPHFVRMHEMTTQHRHEEIQLLALDFSTMLFETTTPLPAYRDWFDATDQTAAYGYLRRVLQVCTFLRRRDEGAPTRWVLKSPQHLAQFGPLLAAFPDATVVVTHREPVAVTASMATMVAYSARMALARPDPVAIGRYWADRVEHLLGACVRDRDLLPADRSLDVRFDDFMADDVALALAVEDLAGLPRDEAGTAAIADYVATHPRGRHGTVEYDLAAVGLDPDERRAALAPYAARFGV
ncbi:MAG: sulfotransferase, partial [Acidimicrobiales bacterium]|nr:sulfotransferase [Acidimicrobiales bacterium]